MDFQTNKFTHKTGEYVHSQGEVSFKKGDTVHLCPNSHFLNSYSLLKVEFVRSKANSLFKKGVNGGLATYPIVRYPKNGRSKKYCKINENLL